MSIYMLDDNQLKYQKTTKSSTVKFENPSLPIAIFGGIRPISEDLIIHFATPRKRQCIGSTTAKHHQDNGLFLSDLAYLQNQDAGKFLNCDLFKRY
ncbi:unnamed protein product [Rhizophagus irregularis]|nr:unnamed protein product [Rhizophagus irregularis]